jgi:hypothetical protein
MTRQDLAEIGKFLPKLPGTKAKKDALAQWVKVMSQMFDMAPPKGVDVNDEMSKDGSSTLGRFC